MLINRLAANLDQQGKITTSNLSLTFSEKIVSLKDIGLDKTKILKVMITECSDKQLRELKQITSGLL